MKKWIFNIVLTVFMLAVMLPVHVMAENANDKIEVTDKGAVTINSDHGAAEGISSLQLSLKVQPTEQNAKVSFEFSDSAAKIAEFRYHEDDGQLNIYLAGEDALFDKSGNLSVGTVVVQNQDGKAVKADVSVVEDSLNYVYVTELKQEKAEIPEEPVTINAGKPTKPGKTDKPASSDKSGKTDKSTAAEQPAATGAGQTAAAEQPVTANAGKSTATVKSGNSGQSTVADAGDSAEPGDSSTGSNNDADSQSDTGADSRSENDDTDVKGREDSASTGIGDYADILLFAGLLLLSIAGLVVFFWFRSNKSDK